MTAEKTAEKAEKAEWRERIKAQRKLLGEEEAAEISRKVTQTYMECSCFKEAEVVLAYCSVKGEFQTETLIQECFRLRKPVAVPKVRTRPTEGAVMDFLFLHPEESFGKGSFGIPEPVTEDVFHPEDWKGRQIEVVLPGLCFDLAGNRIGYGGGYYDRYLERIQDVPLHKTVLAFDFQVTDQLPCGEQDIKFDMLMTEKRIRLTEG